MSGGDPGVQPALSPQQWAFRALPYDLRAEYRKTYLFAWRRMGKAARHTRLLIAREFGASIARIAALLPPEEG